MVRQCFVCKKLDYLNPDMSFHRFPTNLQTKLQYVSILNIHADTLPKSALICSEHFTDSDFLFRGPRQVKYLRKKAVPFPYEETESDPLSISDSTMTKQESASNISILGSFEDENQPSCSKVLKLEYSTSECSTFNGENDINIVQGSASNDSLVSFEDDNPPSCSKTIKREDSGSECSSFIGEKDITFVACRHHEDDLESVGGISNSSSATLTASEPDLETLIRNDRESPIFSKQLPQQTGVKKKVYTAGTLNSSDFYFATPRKAQKYFKMMQTKVKSQQVKIRTLQQTVRRLKARVTKLSTLLGK